MSNITAKTSSNVFYQARCNASAHNEPLSSREGAADIMAIDRGRLYRIENGITNPYPDEIRLMADLYNAPELENYYCTNMCPLGADMPKAEIADLDRISIRALSTFRKLEETSDTALSSEPEGDNKSEDMEMDEIAPTSCGVIVVKDGKILVGTRKDNGLICGPGGHIENGETPEDAAIRETREEFGINVAELIPLWVIPSTSPEYCPSQNFLCTEYYGTPICFNPEMEDARFEDFRNIMKNRNLFPPFKNSLLALASKFGFSRNDEEKWVTAKNGKHFEIEDETGEVTKGNIGVAKPGDKIGSKENNNSKKEQNTNTEKQKNQLYKSAKDVNIKEEIEKRGYKTTVNPEKQAKHVKGPEYVEGKSYVTIPNDEVQKVIDTKSGTGIPVITRKGEWASKEKIVNETPIGVDVDRETGAETQTSKGTIHYSTTGSHLVPRKEN